MNPNEEPNKKARNTGRHRTDVLLVILFLGVAVLMGLGGLIFLIHSKASDASLMGVVSIVSAAVGNLGSLLASTRQHEPPAGTLGDPVATLNVNPPGDPLPVVAETPVPAVGSVGEQEGQETPP